MRTIGLVGGLTWVSTQAYYRHLNEMVQARVGGVESAPVIIWSLNFGDVQRNNLRNDLAANGKLILDACLGLERAGAEAVMIGANTMHMFADEIQTHLRVPLLHLVDAVADQGERLGAKRLLLLGTKYTMEGAFFSDRLVRRGFDVLLPMSSDRDMIHDSIYNEMAKNVFLESTRDAFRKVVQRGVEQGAEAVILGCTEIPVLFEGEQLLRPALDTGYLHALKGADFILS